MRSSSFSASLLGFAVLLLVSAPTLARADDLPVAAPSPIAAPTPDAPAAPDADMAVHERDKAHAVFARTDVGAEGWDVGAGYMHFWRQADSYRGLGGITWMGLGGDARVFAARDPGRVSGAGAFGTARVSFMGDAMGMSTELALGAADIEGRGRALATAGVGMSFLYVDLAYAYQVPIDGGDRAGGIASHMFTARVTIPVVSYERTVKKEKMARREAR
jgi:hypothetical protein